MCVGGEVGESLSEEGGGTVVSVEGEVGEGQSEEGGRNCCVCRGRGG